VPGVNIDHETVLQKPFHLQTWLDQHQQELEAGQQFDLFAETAVETKHIVIGSNSTYAPEPEPTAEVLLLSKRKRARVVVGVARADELAIRL